MTKGWAEYNYGIFLREKDLPDILEKAERSNCNYYMRLNLQGNPVWVGFIAPFESGMDRLHALYYKLRNRKGSTTYLCLGLWRYQPGQEELYKALLSVDAPPDGVIGSREITEFMSVGETRFLTLCPPTLRRLSDDIPVYIEPRN